MGDASQAVWFNRYNQIEDDLRIKREALRQEEIELIHQRDLCLRNMVGDKRGGISECAERLGVSSTQVIRTLARGNARSITRALNAAGIDRERYQIVERRGGRKIAVLATGVDEQTLVNAVNGTDMALQGVDVVLDAAESSDLRRLASEVTTILTSEGVPNRMIKVEVSRTAVGVELSTTAAASGLAPEVICRCLEILREQDSITSEIDSSERDHVDGGTDLILIRRAGTKSKIAPVALVFGWA